MEWNKIISVDEFPLEKFIVFYAPKGMEEHQKEFFSRIQWIPHYYSEKPFITLENLEGFTHWAVLEGPR
jgi:hypothetical protein